MKQIDKMQDLYRQYGDSGKTVQEYARAEDRGEVMRRSNKNNITSEEYARRLLYDGIKKGWLAEKL